MGAGDLGKSVNWLIRKDPYCDFILPGGNRAADLITPGTVSSCRNISLAAETSQPVVGTAVST